jgi:hypothetical protein
MAFDAAHGQVVLFGGRTADGQTLGDTWTWDGGSWTQQHPRQSPSARSDAHMGFDAAHGVVVMYGGSGGLTRYGGYSPTSSRPSDPAHETWTWDGSSWHQVVTGQRPDGQIAGLAYDEKRGQLLLVDVSFGMATAYGSGGVMHAPGHVAPASPLPALGGSGAGGGVSSAPHLQVVPTPAAPQAVQVRPLPAEPAPTPVQFQDIPPQLQTWSWTGSDWKLLKSNVGSGMGWSNAQPAWDAASRRVAMLTLETGSQRCVEFSPPIEGPQGALAPGVAGGSAGIAATHGSATPKPGAIGAPPTPVTLAPTTRIIQQPACNDMVERSIGSPTSNMRCTGCPLAHQWSWDGSTWRETTLGNVSFIGEQVAADPTTGRLIAVDSEHTWTWNGSSWTAHPNPAGLRQRNSFMLAADTAHNVVVLFGGRSFEVGTNSADADTWTWNGSSWTHVAGTVPPPEVSSSTHGGPPSSVCLPKPSVAPVAADGSLTIALVLPSTLVECGGGFTVTVTLVDPSGSRLDVVNNPGQASQPFPSTLRWTNWCGTRAGSVVVRTGNATQGLPLDHFPTCTDRSKPSQLSVGVGGHPGLSIP